MTWTIIKIVVFGLLLLYVAAVIFLYFQQDRFIFFPNLLEKDYEFQGFHNFEEVVLEETNSKYWHALYFKKEQPKELFFTYMAILVIYNNGVEWKKNFVN